MFSFNLSDELKLILKKLSKKDSKRAKILNKKIKEIISCDEKTIHHYKNLKRELKNYKRVHIDSSFILFFQVYKKEKHILFVSLEHHDDAYKR